MLFSWQYGKSLCATELVCLDEGKKNGWLCSVSEMVIANFVVIMVHGWGCHALWMRERIHVYVVRDSGRDENEG